MDQVLENASVQRVMSALKNSGIDSEITILSDSARSAKEAADSFSSTGLKVVPSGKSFLVTVIECPISSL